MRFGQAFTYVFNDKAWFEKLALVVILGAFAMIPIFGLIAVAVLLGYMLDLVANMLRRQKNPLPVWDRFGDKVARGGTLMGAMLVYNIPNLLLAGCSMTALGIFPRDTGGAAFSLAFLCCITPFMFIYTVLAWTMLALGAARYAETGNAQALYQFGRLFSDIRQHQGSVAQWIIGTLLVNLVCIVLAIIPCLGWVPLLAFALPWHGYMLGQFAVIARSWAGRPSGSR